MLDILHGWLGIWSWTHLLLWSAVVLGFPAIFGGLPWLYMRVFCPDEHASLKDHLSGRK